MRKAIFLSILITTIILISPVIVLATGDHDRSVEGVLDEIRESQNVAANSDLKCDEINDEQFEELGDAVMSVMHPDERQHELMDQAMGGEGSDSLRAMHAMMGQRYLGCLSGVSDGITKGVSTIMSMMMGGGMMGGWLDSMMKGGENSMMSNMMGWSNWGMAGGWIWMILFWVLIIVAIIALIRWSMNQGRPVGKGKSGLDILKERYAKGEIDKKEFEEKKRDISQ